MMSQGNDFGIKTIFFCVAQCFQLCWSKLQMNSNKSDNNYGIYNLLIIIYVSYSFIAKVGNTVSLILVAIALISRKKSSRHSQVVKTPLQKFFNSILGLLKILFFAAEINTSKL